jgi:hypothetical protein
MHSNNRRHSVYRRHARSVDLLLAVAAFAGGNLLHPCVADVAPGVENIARGKRYTMTPVPGYRDTIDAGDRTQLTDGEYSSGYFWVQKSTVGWVRDPQVTLTFDLGADLPIRGVTFNTAAGSAAGVFWPKGIRVLASMDGRSYHELGDLITLDRNRPAPSEDTYGLHKFVADKLHVHGRYVKLIIDSNESYVVVDEVEIWRGEDAWLNEPLPGVPVRFPMAYDSGDPLTNAVMGRIGTDVATAMNFVSRAQIDGALRARLLAEALGIEQRIGALPTVDPAGFRAVVPINALHAQAYAICGAARAAQGKPPLVAWRANPWDFLTPLELPDKPPAAAIAVAAMRGETRAGVLNMANCTTAPIHVSGRFTGLPGGSMPPYIVPHKALWTDTRQGVLVAAALPELTPSPDGFSFVIPAGMTRQLWLNVTPRDLPAGKHKGALILTGPALPAVPVPVELRVFNLDFPDRPTLHLGGWDETDGDKPRYGVNAANRDALVAHLRSRFVDSPWSTPAVMPFGAYGEDGTMTQPPDTSSFDMWLKRWPDARRFCVFNSVRDNIAGRKMGDPLFAVQVGHWIRFWVAFLRERGVEPDRLVLLLLDEPRKPAHDRIIIAWARAIKAAAPDVVLWEDPVYKDPKKMASEMLSAVDVLCPNRRQLLQVGEPLAALYRKQQAQGKRLELYSCTGPARLLDPYAYHRLQAWHCFAIGAAATHFWAFCDTGGVDVDSWNEYLSTRHSYTPLFLGPKSVTAGRHMEALRESVEDYEYLVMLRERIAQLQKTNGAHPRLTAARQLLATAPGRVLLGAAADQMRWQQMRDRSVADTVRIEIGDMLESLRLPQ